ncbi:hypothetical protein B1H58_09090 [Pantoea alhagi]|uniref:Uncharacterized protein n=1 Tax=Pantoea alhagi TaxID=1891675 RepID=A0A1W6B505_9GAMM|nr:hypothetical protein B1H58_09090 [Pantoea alhagi]
MWITAYKPGFCWGLQQTVIFLQFSGCRQRRTPYNAPPSTRHNGLRHAVLSGSAKSESPEKNF